MKKSQFETLIREVIRETIRKVDGKYVVYPEKGGKRLGTHSTKKAAEKQLTAIHLNKEGTGGADTSWIGADNEKITLQDILDLTKNIKVVNYPTQKLAKVVLDWDNNPEEIERISQVTVSSQYPILIMVDEQNKIQWILDGNHRAQKALRSKAETIPAKLIKPSDLNAKAKKILLGITEASSYSNNEAVEPNFDFEWKEATRYPEFKKLGKAKWIELAKTGKAITITSAKDINNTDANEPNAFKTLDPNKQKRALAQLKSGNVEMPIVALYSDGYKELVAGNTRLTAMMAQNKKATIWQFEVPEEIEENYSELEQYRKLILKQLIDSKIGKQIRNAVEDKVGKEAVEGVYIIGSVLDSKKFHEESDIDIAVVINVPNMDKGANEKMSYELSQTYSIPDGGFVDVSIWNRSKPLGKRVKLKEGTGGADHLNKENYADGKVNEAKQVGNLYHYTSADGLKGILQSNSLNASEEEYLGNELYYISFTRNKNFHKKGHSFNVRTDYRITLDGDKLSSKYKIKPFAYKPGWNYEYSWEFDWLEDEPESVARDFFDGTGDYDEQEERISFKDASGSISNIKDYILKVDKVSDLKENYADGKVKGKSRPGRVKKAGASCKGSVSDLRAKAKKYGGEKGKMYHWCANMKGGKKK